VVLLVFLDAVVTRSVVRTVHDDDDAAAAGNMSIG
jgi:hypothetical protein